MAKEQGKEGGKGMRRTAVRMLVLPALTALAATVWLLLLRSPPANIVLITLDTTRWDYVDPANERARAIPNLQKLAARGAYFGDAVTVAPLTLPAHTSLFTGLYPSMHGVRNNGNYILPEGIPLLAEILSRESYETAAFVGCFVLDSRFGLSRGFDHYDDQLAEGPLGDQSDGGFFNLTAERNASWVTDRAIRWVTAKERSPFFLWVHYYDPHDPYEAPPPFREMYKEDPYAGEIAYVDQEIGRLLPYILRDRDGESTALIVVADHGESLGQHGEITHGLFLYEPSVRIPLIMVLPGVTEPGTRVERTARIIDIMPTLLEYLGIDLPRVLDGKSLLPVLAGHAGEKQECVAETLYPLENFGWSPLFSLRSPPFKYIQAPNPELYDLSRDPGEEKNIASELPEVAETMATKLTTQLTSREGQALDRSPGQASGSRTRLDPETQARLAQLGYIWTAPGGRENRLRDPKDMVETKNLLTEAQSFLDARRYREALERFKVVLQKDPENTAPWNQIGIIFYRMEQPDSALFYLKMAESKDSTNANTHHNLALLYEKSGHPDMALEEYEKTTRCNPSSVEDLVALGKIRFRLEDLGGALESFGRALSLEPENAHAYAGLADVAMRQGRYQEAIDRLTEGIEKSPPRAVLHNKLGTIYQRLGRSNDALAEYEKALRIDPHHLDAVFNRGTIRSERGLLDEAAADFVRLLEHPDYRAKALFSLAVIHEKRGERQKAIDMYSDFISAWDGDPAVREDALRRIEKLGGG